MFDLLPVPLPWYLVGPLMGLCVAGLYAVTNRHLGISGAYAETFALVRGRARGTWQICFVGGTFAGAAVVAILGRSPQAGWKYGALGDQLSPLALTLVLLAGGALIGFGARLAGGCTSGHGITGCSTRSPGSFVAVGTFVVTAVAVTFLLHWATGGDL